MSRAASAALQRGDPRTKALNLAAKSDNLSGMSTAAPPREWFYVREGSQVGPISQGQFEELVQSGGISAATMVWTSGLPNWTPYSALPADVSAMDATRLVNCNCCGRLLSSEDVIELGATRVCADCKPIYIQRLKEGLSPYSGLPAGRERYGGFWIRVGAKLIDGVLLWIVNTLISVVLILVLFGTVEFNPEDKDSLIAFLIVYVAMLVIQVSTGVAYSTWMVGKYGATLGKMACNLRIITPDGKPTYLRAFGRHWAEMVSAMTLGIGYLMVVFDEERRSLHDRICNTWVVKT